MVQKNSVYRKSAHGAEALARRDPALTLRLRSLLIMVDGKRPVEELSRLSPSGAETDQLMTQLDDLGMIELATAPAVAAPAAVASPSDTQQQDTAAPRAAEAAPGPVTVRVVPLADARRAAVRRLTDLLGPMADDLCVRMEAAKTAQDLLALVKRAEQLVKTTRGAEAAAAFHAHMESHRPA